MTEIPILIFLSITACIPKIHVYPSLTTFSWTQKLSSLVLLVSIPIVSFYEGKNNQNIFCKDRANTIL